MNETNPGDAADRLRSAGWCQGSVVRLSDLEQVGADNDPAGSWPIVIRSPSPRTSCAVITQSCDLLNLSLQKEPWVEIVLARPGAPNAQLERGRNPRRLQVPASEGNDEVTLELSVHDRIRVSRQNLVDLVPDADRALEPGSRRLIAQWISKRYVRAAFPDEFNRRMDTVRRKIERVFKKHADSLVTAFVRLEPDHELSGDEDYQCAVALVYPHGELDVDTAEGIGEKFKRAITGCNGIEVRGVTLRSNREFTLYDMDLMSRWDYLDHYSDADSDAPRPPSSLDGETGGN